MAQHIFLSVKEHILIVPARLQELVTKLFYAAVNLEVRLFAEK